MKKAGVDMEFEKIKQKVVYEEMVPQSKEDRKKKFAPLSIADLITLLGTTIKEDNNNKVITFLCCLSAFTENSQFNLSFNAPSSSGKSYIPIEVGTLFPKEDVIEVGYCSPTAFFHDHGMFDKDVGGYVMNLDRKLMIFLDQPHDLLLAHLRPLLSHDKKEIRIKITDKSQKFGLKTKNVIIIGYPAVIFCSAGLKIDEQEATRFLLLSPEITQEKIRQGVIEALNKDSNRCAYFDRLNKDPQRQLLIARIAAIKDEKIAQINIHDPRWIEGWFLNRHKNLQPRHQRDIKRLVSIIKGNTLLNLWHRKTDGPGTILTSDDDIQAGFKIWEDISFSQELNLPPYLYNFFEEIIQPLYAAKNKGLTRAEVLKEHYRVYGRPLAEHKLSREVIPMLEMSGLISQETDL